MHKAKTSYYEVEGILNSKPAIWKIEFYLVFLIIGFSNIGSETEFRYLSFDSNEPVFKWTRINQNGLANHCELLLHATTLTVTHGEATMTWKQLNILQQSFFLHFFLPLETFLLSFICSSFLFAFFAFPPSSSFVVLYFRQKISSSLRRHSFIHRLFRITR